MSQENVEIVRQSFPAYDRGGLDALAEFWHPDISWRAAEGALDDVGLMEGPDALRHYYEQWEDTFESARTEVEELVDVVVSPTTRVAPATLATRRPRWGVTHGSTETGQSRYCLVASLTSASRRDHALQA